MIRQSSIRQLEAYTRGMSAGTKVVAALRVGEGALDRLVEAGFVLPIEEGQSVLPSAHLGRTAEFNAEGREEVHKDLPKETVYRAVEWTHDQWNGPYTETVTEVIERPYERYPRTFIEPPAVELTTKRSRDGTIFVCAPPRILGEEDERLLHDVNLVLNISKECELLTEDLISPIQGNIRRLNWNVLPRGHYPWETLRPHVQPTLERLPQQAKPVIEHRLEAVAQYPHEFVAIGTAGFAGYVIFAFPRLGIYVLECTHEGNATYVLGRDWAEISQLTKAEILRGNLHLERLVHVRGWRHMLAQVMHRYRR